MATATKKKSATKSKAIAERPVLVTTAHRGVFFGYASDTSGETIKLRACRNCVRWSRAMKGFIGLASVGPDSDCRIGKAKLTETDIPTIRQLLADGVSQGDVARKYGVHNSQISRIFSRSNWSHV